MRTLGEIGIIAVYFGTEPATFIDPANSALKANITFTIHHDAPVTPPT